MIIVLGSAKVKLEQIDAAVDLSLNHVHRSRTEPGCVSHEVSIDAEDSSHLVFVERWTDMPALLTHFDLEESKAFIRDLTPLLSEAPSLRIYGAEEMQTRS